MGWSIARTDGYCVCSAGIIGEADERVRVRREDGERVCVSERKRMGKRRRERQKEKEKEKEKEDGSEK